MVGQPVGERVEELQPRVREAGRGEREGERLRRPVPVRVGDADDARAGADRGRAELAHVKRGQLGQQRGREALRCFVDDVVGEFRLRERVRVRNLRPVREERQHLRLRQAVPRRGSAPRPVPAGRERARRPRPVDVVERGHAGRGVEGERTDAPHVKRRELRRERIREALLRQLASGDGGVVPCFGPVADLAPRDARDGDRRRRGLQRAREARRVDHLARASPR